MFAPTISTSEATRSRRSPPAQPRSLTAGIGNRAALRALPRIGPSHRPPATILPELKVGRVDDPAELEADAVAERIMNARPPATSGGSRAAALRRKCDACENDELSRAPLGRGDLGGT